MCHITLHDKSRDIYMSDNNGEEHVFMMALKPNSCQMAALSAPRPKTSRCDLSSLITTATVSPYAGSPYAQVRGVT